MFGGELEFAELVAVVCLTAAFALWVLWKDKKDDGPPKGPGAKAS